MDIYWRMVAVYGKCHLSWTSVVELSAEWTHTLVLQMLMEDYVNHSFIQVVFTTDATGLNFSISSDHFINSCNRLGS